MLLLCDVVWCCVVLFLVVVVGLVNLLLLVLCVVCCVRFRCVLVVVVRGCRLLLWLSVGVVGGLLLVVMCRCVRWCMVLLLLDWCNGCLSLFVVRVVRPRCAWLL